MDLVLGTCTSLWVERGRDFRILKPAGMNVDSLKLSPSVWGVASSRSSAADPSCSSASSFRSVSSLLEGVFISSAALLAKVAAISSSFCVESSVGAVVVSCSRTLLGMVFTSLSKPWPVTSLESAGSEEIGATSSFFTSEFHKKQPHQNGIRAKVVTAKLSI